MRAPYEHPWDVTPQKAIRIQAQLHNAVITTDEFGPIRHVAGIDIGYLRDNAITRAAVAVLSFPDLELREQAIATRPTTFPYVPGLLSFREALAAIDALAGLTIAPDLLLCDGQGLAHPRRFGLACHLGLLSDIPSIGVAKTRLTGEHDPVPLTRGAWVPLKEGGEVIGAVLSTRTKVKPLFISVGYRISLETAIDFVMACTPKYRLPETTRCADRLASGKKKAEARFD